MRPPVAGASPLVRGAEGPLCEVPSTESPGSPRAGKAVHLEAPFEAPGQLAEGALPGARPVESPGPGAPAYAHCPPD
ncbi:hypothetical protein N7517_008954 [Penicillium concentricum]|uniref:Uncharacterized protein n=1 Tax=Penicillium concentricum TaxID=293559 RepID=A0A9W9RGB4_9EURO|nr:uncharacterized protein N7517_008948 [Penicillium concentricum]XP_056575252.1 uncharacterized protein N7517_008954 [Penicillium concentricum]KAJ5359757.1 hypothetical protein N7517_008948 [Penicillium concentricum]KAJ5359763.1 hypothetical protein N7517_008954 [Penicillium concentricum]